MGYFWEYLGMRNRSKRIDFSTTNFSGVKKRCPYLGMCFSTRKWLGNETGNEFGNEKMPIQKRGIKSLKELIFRLLIESNKKDRLKVKPIKRRSCRMGSYTPPK